MAEVLPEAAVPVLATLLDALVDEEAEVFPDPAPPAALTVPVLADALLLPFCPVPLAFPLPAWADPWVDTEVVLVTVAFTALLEPLPIEPPVAIFPPPLFVTVVVVVAPVADTDPLPAPPLFVVVFDTPVAVEAEVPEDGAAPLVELVEGEDALVLVLPDWPVPEAAPLVPLAWPLVAAEVVFVEVVFELVGNCPLLPLPPPPLGPPAIEPPVAVPLVLVVVESAAAPLVPLMSNARHTEPVVAARFFQLSPGRRCCFIRHAPPQVGTKPRPFEMT